MENGNFLWHWGNFPFFEHRIFILLSKEFPFLSAEFPISEHNIPGSMFRAPLQFLRAKVTFSEGRISRFCTKFEIYWLMLLGGVFRVA